MSLAANDIHMDPVGQTRVPNNGRPHCCCCCCGDERVDDDDVLGEESTEALAALFKLKNFTHVYASRSGCVAKKKHE